MELWFMVGPMFQPIEITEITERPPTGVSSRPFRCLGEDGFGYYVKLGTALPDEKIAEWMFGFLASELGLPTPIGAIVLVDEELSRNAVLDTSEFGHGIGYGSREVAAAHDLTAPDAEGIETSLMAETLLFDWWILNEDRKLGQFGGNPNILISSEKEISLIDHGNAMDQDFDPDAFFEDHAFRQIRDYWNRSDRLDDGCDGQHMALLPLKYG